MIKNKLCVLLSIACVSSSLAGLNKNNDVPGHKLQLNQEVYFTDKLGVALPEQIAEASLGKLVKIYRTDGFCYEGKITDIEEEEGVFKVYGDVLNLTGVRFGFAMAKGGKFAGAVLDKVNDTVYVLEFSEAHKGFVLVRSYKHDKITS